MSRDPRKLRVLEHADSLLIAVYRATASFPAEARYLLNVAWRLGFLSARDHEPLEVRYTELTKGLQKLIKSLENEP